MVLEISFDCNIIWRFDTFTSNCIANVLCRLFSWDHFNAITAKEKSLDTASIDNQYDVAFCMQASNRSKVSFLRLQSKDSNH